MNGMRDAEKAGATELAPVEGGLMRYRSWDEVGIADGWAVKSATATRSARQGALRRLFRRCARAVRALLRGY
jgi:hypothetical protein